MNRLQPADSVAVTIPVGAVVDVHDSIDAIAADWAAFERHAAGSLFQSLLWCRAWHETIGRAIGAAPRIVTVRDQDGQLLALLPFQVRRQLGIRVLEWLTTPHGSYGSALYHRNVADHLPVWIEAAWPSMLHRLGGFDAVALTNMPSRLCDGDHPLTHLFNMRCANLTFCMRLDADFAALHAAKRKSEDRRANRKKEEALAKDGPLAFDLPETPESIHATLDTMFAHQAERLAERGVHGTFGQKERKFIHRLADLQNPVAPVLRPYRLIANGQILAVMMGGVHGGVFWALVSSLAPRANRRHSPGDVALRKTIKACCEEGLAGLDFSVGDSTYKRAWADDVIQLNGHIGARTLQGLVWTMGFAVRETAKRLIKSSPVLMTCALSIRRACFGNRPN